MTRSNPHPDRSNRRLDGCTLPDVPAAKDDPPVELNRRRPPGKAPTLEESVAAHPSNPRPRPTTDGDGQGDAA